MIFMSSVAEVPNHGTPEVLICSKNTKSTECPERSIVPLVDQMHLVDSDEAESFLKFPFHQDISTKFL